MHKDHVLHAQIYGYKDQMLTRRDQFLDRANEDTDLNADKSMKSRLSIVLAADSSNVGLRVFFLP